jgi:hypothetical protein
VSGLNITTGGTGQTAGFHVKISAPPAALSSLFVGIASNATIFTEMRIQTTGAIVMYAAGGAAAALPIQTNICDGNWHWVEFTQTGSTGINTFTVYVDGVVQGTVQTGSVGTGSTTTYAFNSINGVTVSIDDVIIWDTGTAPFTAFPLGPRQIIVKRPASDNTVNFATLSAGATHYNLVNEVNPDGNASYCADATSAHQDLFNMGSMGVPPATITAAISNLYVTNPGGGSFNHQHVCKSGAASASNSTATFTPIASYLTTQAVYATDPNTSAAWTAANLDAALFGYRVA